ncbi:MAG: GtrA family protein [Candidatus Woykebacteria bacterium]
MFIDLFKIRLDHSEKTGSLAEKFFFQLYRRRTLWKFAMVGTSGAIIDYSLFFVLTRFLGLPPLAANPISVEAAIIWNFTWNNIWTFSARTVPKPLWKKFLTFQLVSLGGLLLSQNSLFLFSYLLNIFDLIAKALTIPIVALFNYLVNSRWTFRDISRGRSRWYAYVVFIFTLFIFYLILTY